MIIIIVVESPVQCLRVPLFEGSQVAEQEAIVALLSLPGGHRLTYTCIKDMLQLVSSLLPVPNGVSQTTGEICELLRRNNYT